LFVDFGSIITSLLALPENSTNTPFSFRALNIYLSSLERIFKLSNVPISPLFKNKFLSAFDSIISIKGFASDLVKSGI
jgi:hypothetical protein